MQRNTFLITIFKTIFAFAILFLLAMNYWSSLLVEEDLQTLKQEVETLKVKFSKAPQNGYSNGNSFKKDQKDRKYIDPNLPNLLVGDPFFEKTLPKMLPPDFTPTGTREMATIGKPDSLHPFSNWYEASTWQNWCTVSVSNSTFGFYEKYSPNAAIKVEEKFTNEGKSLEYWIHLRDDLYWQPLKQDFFSAITLSDHFLKKHPVTAHDFKFRYDVIMNPFVTDQSAVVLRQFYADIEEVKVVDDYTLVMKWKTYPVKTDDGNTVMKPKYMAKTYTLGFSPLASFLYQYDPDGKKLIEEDQGENTYKVNSSFAQQFTQHWAKNVIPSCGPLVFDGMTDESIRFRRNDDYYQPLDCLVGGTRVQFKQTADGMWQAFKQGSLDNYAMLPEHLIEYQNFIKTPAYQEQVAQGLKINRLDYLFRSFAYIGWNEARPLFKSRKVRQAMTMAIDRPRIVKQIMNGMAEEISCPFFPYSEAYDDAIKPLPFDPQTARRLLEEEGFIDLDGSGILAKKTNEGILKFEFSLTYYVKNPVTKAICESIATSLKKIGVKCNLNGVDIADLSALFDDKNFDAYFLSWVFSSPPEDPRQLWHSSGAKEKGTSNAIGFANPEVDKIIEDLTYEYNQKRRIELYHRFDAILHDEQPYTLLYTPRLAFLYRDYLQNVFLPVDRQDLIPGATVAEPQPSIFWLKKLKTGK